MKHRCMKVFVEPLLIPFAFVDVSALNQPFYFGADPGRQLIPRAWVDSAHDPVALADSVYHYTKRLLNDLENDGLISEFVKVDNENNPGILGHVPEEDGFGTARTVSSNKKTDAD